MSVLYFWWSKPEYSDLGESKPWRPLRSPNEVSASGGPDPGLKPSQGSLHLRRRPRWFERLFRKSGVPRLMSCNGRNEQLPVGDYIKWNLVVIFKAEISVLLLLLLFIHTGLSIYDVTQFWPPTPRIKYTSTTRWKYNVPSMKTGSKGTSDRAHHCSRKLCRPSANEGRSDHSREVRSKAWSPAVAARPVCGSRWTTGCGSACRLKWER